MVFITTLNFLGMIAWYGAIGHRIEQAKKYGYSVAPLQWGDWVVIISAIGSFIFYILSLRRSGFQNVHKYVKTFLLLVPTIVVLYLTCNAIHLELQVYYDTRNGYDDGVPFTCGEVGDYTCYLQYTNLFMELITALFVVIEIGATLAWGPLEAQAHRFRGRRVGMTRTPMSSSSVLISHTSSSNSIITPSSNSSSNNSKPIAPICNDSSTLHSNPSSSAQISRRNNSRNRSKGRIRL
ncbi:hypothetical protein BKA57DRAFT_499975 [Linnemannia elongata]|nr:hypothetical protein BKA57DRAFT_499975 [Linnemannia elongata]